MSKGRNTTMRFNRYYDLFLCHTGLDPPCNYSTLCKILSLPCIHPCRFLTVLFLPLLPTVYKNVPHSIPCLQIYIPSVTKTTSETIHHTLCIFLRLYRRQPLFHQATVKRLHDAGFVCVEETGNNYLTPRKS